MKQPDPSGDLAVSELLNGSGQELDSDFNIQPIPHKSKFQSKNTIEE